MNEQKKEEETKKKAFIEIASMEANEKEEWHWLLWSANGRKMAMNAEPYETKKACVAAVKAMMRSVGEVAMIVQAGETIEV